MFNFFCSIILFGGGRSDVLGDFESYFEVGVNWVKFWKVSRYFIGSGGCKNGVEWVDIKVWRN